MCPSQCTSDLILCWPVRVACFEQQVQEDQGAPQTADGGDPYVRAVCFSPDGLSIVAGMEKNSAKVLVLEEEGGRQGAITLSGHEVWLLFLRRVGGMFCFPIMEGDVCLRQESSVAFVFRSHHRTAARLLAKHFVGNFFNRYQSRLCPIDRF